MSSSPLKRNFSPLRMEDLESSPPSRFSRIGPTRTRMRSLFEPNTTSNIVAEDNAIKLQQWFDSIQVPELSDEFVGIPLSVSGNFGEINISGDVVRKTIYTAKDMKTISNLNREVDLGSSMIRKKLVPWKRIFNEVWCQHIASIHDLAPKIIGFNITESTTGRNSYPIYLVHIYMELVSTNWWKSETSLLKTNPDLAIHNLFAKLKKLHEIAGIRHGDIKIEHLAQRNNEFMFIDFGNASPKEGVITPFFTVIAQSSEDYSTGGYSFDTNVVKRDNESLSISIKNMTH